ncbi:MAG TPA: pseudouridine-5'-phosphate glycosidase, partial [Bacilli bacterium]|nr:pseudouridine-5'-phosphate glycosidase [Bacilli bacterium]
MFIRPDVERAIKLNRPVVALESTIISHGMPYPENVKTALMLENIISEAGAVPATIGIIDGDIVVGMSPEQIEEFGKRRDIRKVSRRDLPVVVAKKEWGATTVAATMIIAEKAGIEVFVTGGIGGVHRNAATTFDISADLEEFAMTDVTVISSGAKAILDLPLTLEYLETKGVTVLSYQSDEFASFYSRDSGLKI